jgi:hypothetical protein
MREGWLRLGNLTGLVLGILLAVPCDAAQIEGVEFEERVTVGDQVLALQSLGLLRYRVFFKAYVAALYLEPGVGPESALRAVPKRLEIEYFWPIDGEDFGPVAEKVLARNVEGKQLQRLQPKIRALHDRYEDVQPGDRYALTFIPGKGTELAKNGVRLAVVPGDEFAEAYFRIWLGDASIDRKLRDQLLKQP